MLEDESSYLQYGQTVETEYFNFKMKETLPSGWINYPTEASPNTLYKFISVEINLSLDLISWERSTYNVLDWLGDLGGLYDALFILLKALLSPIAGFTLYSTLLTKFFRFRASEPEVVTKLGGE